MEDKELYQHILGLETPWSVAEVKLDLGQQQIDIHVSHPRGTKFCCPVCNQSLSCYDHVPARKWRHLDSCQYKTILHASVPRVKCPEHGVKQVNVPWAEKSSRFTLMFERFAIDLLQATPTVTGAMGILRISWDQTWNIILRAVQRGQARKAPKLMPRLGIDEKAFKKGQSYMTMLFDLDNSTVEAISEGNNTESGIACFSQLSTDQINAVEAIAMDMSAAYVKATKASIPLAEEKIVHDVFHVMKLANEAVDKVRRGEHRERSKAGDNRLAKTKYIWLTGQENLSEKQEAKLNEVFTQQLETGKAWSYKELLRDLWAHETDDQATDYFNHWYRRVIHTKLKPMKKVARTIKERMPNVVSYCTHRITNAVAEGINSKIMAIKRRVGGYRNPENFKTAIYFYCGGLDLYPQ